MAGLLTVQGLALGMGFFEYLLSLPLAIAALGVVLRGPKLPWQRLGLLGALALGSELAHPFTLVALLPALAVVAWARRATAWRVGLSLLPAVVVAAVTFTSHVDAPTPVTQPTVWTPLGESLRTLAMDGFGGLGPTGLVGLAGMVALLLLGAASAWRDGGWASRMLLLCAVLYAILTIATPSSALNWSLFHHRFVPLVWLVASVALGGATPSTRSALLGLGLAGLALLAESVIATTKNLEIDRSLREYASAAPLVPRASRLLPLNFDPRGESEHRLIRPMLHAWAYVLMERGGMTPYVFATLPSHAFHFQDRPKAPGEFLDQSYSCERAGLGADTPQCEAFHRRRLETYASRATAFDAVLTWKAPAELRALLESSGFEQRHQAEHVAVYLRTARPAVPAAQDE